MTQQDYDFYGSTAPQVAAPANAAPRPPVYGQPTNQFGTPTAWASPVAAAPVAPVRGGVRVPAWAWRLGVTLVVLLVLGLFGVGRLGFLNQPDLEPPATLGGLVPATDPTTQQILAETVASVRADNPDSEVEGQAYTDAAGADTVLLMNADFRSDTDSTVDDILASSGPTATGLGEAVEVGDATCVPFLQEYGVICVRSGWTTSSVLMVVSTSGVATPDRAAALLDEAWDR